MISATAALSRLRSGNQRFVDGVTHAGMDLHEQRRIASVAGQRPIAAVLGCSDSRVPVEIVFDQALGDLFVIRVAGNVVASSQIGSVEFAAEQFGIRLVVVLGHTQCGAVTATLDELRRPTESQSANLRSIVGRIRPAVEGLLHTELRHNEAQLFTEAVCSNVRSATNALRYGSQVLEQMAERDGLMIVGAVYSLETGAVEFIDA